MSNLNLFKAVIGLGTHLFASTRRQRSDLFGLRVKLPPVTTSITTQKCRQSR